MGVITLHPELTRRPGPYPRGRRCIHPACITLLSTFDPGPACWQHAPAQPCTPHEHRLALADLLSDPAA